MSEPQLSIGCPIYNSDEARLRRSLDSVLAQTFEDFEVIICDNSPDGPTRDICMGYAERDPRVQYFDNAFNYGASVNFWRVLHIARGRYFKWVADDDQLDASYFRRCIEVLENDPAIALCYSRIKSVTPEGEAQDDAGGRIEAMQESAAQRFVSVLERSWRAHGFYGIFRKEHLMRIHPVSDECIRLADIMMLAEISLYGKIFQIPEELFTYTQHVKEWDDREKLNARHYDACFPNAQQRGITFPNVKFAYELMQAVRYSDLSLDEKAKLYAAVPQLIHDRINGFWGQEIRRAVTLVLNQRIFHEWGVPAHEPVADAVKFERIPPVYHFHAAELLRRFEEVMQVWPGYPQPGLYSARAVLLALLDRLPEAMNALHIELAKFPTFEPAKQLLKNLETATRQRSAG